MGRVYTPYLLSGKEGCVYEKLRCVLVILKTYCTPGPHGGLLPTSKHPQATGRAGR